MNKSIMCLILAGLISAGTMQAFAADGTVHFSGSLTDAACTVSTATKDQTVVLGNIPSASFNAAGDKSTSVDFTIDLSNCPASVLKVLTKFDGVSDAANTSLLALDTGETATGVGIEIAEQDGTPIALHTASKTYAVDTTAHTVSLPYLARYVSTVASVGAGTANGTSQFTLNYQ